MEIKRDLELNQQNTDKTKVEKKPPTRNFQEVMATRKVTRPVERRRSIFDVASKNQQKPERKKEGSPTQHGEGAKEVSISLTMGESLSVGSVKVLSADMSALIEKMANYVIHESQKGVSTTTVVVEMDGSPLDGMEVVLDHYDTAPHSFNLHLSGSPEAQDLLTANLTSLQASLQTHQALQGFQVHILPPTLSEKSDLHDRGKKVKERVGKSEKGALFNTPKKISF